MRIKDEILEELRKRTPLAEIRRKYRSQSQLYEAIREFLEETDKIVEEGQERLEKVEGGLLEAETELKRVDHQKKEVSMEVEELSKSREKLSKEVARKTEHLDSLNKDIAELRVKGFTSQILKKIKTIEDRSGPELLSQVETVEKYRQIEKELSSLKNKKSVLEGKVRDLETRKEKMEERAISEKNMLDELKLRIATFKEAVATVRSLFRDGYSTKDIQSLKHGLDMLGIKGDPLLSISRLVKGLEKQRSLVALEDRVAEERKELTMLKKALAVTKIELKVAKQVTKVFEDIKAAGVKAISETAEQTNKTIKSAEVKFETQLRESLVNFDACIQQTMEGVREELGEWGELQQQKGKLEETLDYCLVLLGILKSTEFLKKVPLSLVVQLFDRLHLWSEMNLKDISIRPSENIHNKENKLQTWHSYKLPVLIEFVYEDLKQIMIQQSR